MRVDQADVALRACVKLEDSKIHNSTEYRYIGTLVLLNQLGYSRPFGRYRKVLQRLANIGVLEREGSGKFRWRIKNPKWNRINPLRTEPEGAKPKPEEPEEEKIELYNIKEDLRGEKLETVIQIQGKTYRHREALKAAGCVYSRHGWTIPWIQLHKLVNIIGNYAELVLLDLVTNPPKPDGIDYGPAIENLKKRLEKIEDIKRVEIVLKDSKGKEIKHFKEHTHPIFEQVMFHVNCGDNVMLVGPKGCGKTFIAEQIADALGRRCGIFPISGGVTEGKLFGRVVPNINTGKSKYQATLLVDLFEKGGVALIDEVDAGDPNVLIGLNSALANGKLTLDRMKNPTAERHEHFICLAAANTWGNGADRQYVGRNQLDSAFVERFVQLEMDYDRGLERSLCKGAGELVDRMHKYRDAVVANRLERTISTRLLLRAYNWMQHGKDFEYIDKMVFAGWRDDEIKRVKGG